MDKIKIKEVIAVEGRYDVHAVSACFDTEVIGLGGFGIYKNAQLRATVKAYAQKCGLILLTDPDPAGFMIRARVAQCVPEGTVLHAYVPDVPGKERRKQKKSSAGTLGVEGMSRETIISAVLSAGATRLDGENAAQTPEKEKITRTDLYEDGLLGGQDSSRLRLELTKTLGLPAAISVSGLVGALNRLSSREEYRQIVRRIKEGEAEKC